MTENVKESFQDEIKSNMTSTNSDIQVHFSNTSKKFPEGLLMVYRRPLLDVNQEIIELTIKQELCIKKLQLENKKLCDFQEHLELHNLFATIEACNRKLSNIKCDIKAVHERTFKLKKKVLKFQQFSKPQDL